MILLCSNTSNYTLCSAGSTCQPLYYQNPRCESRLRSLFVLLVLFNREGPLDADVAAAGRLNFDLLLGEAPRELLLVLCWGPREPALELADLYDT